MTTITIHDEATRRVLKAALWKRVRAVVDPGDMTAIGSDIADLEEAELGYSRYPLRDARAAVDEILVEVVDLMAAIDRLATAHGEFDMKVSLEDLLCGVEYAKDGIEEYGNLHLDGGFFAQAPEVRETLLASRDAASRLLAEFKPEAVS